jgi:hypothetical protein
MSSGGTMNALDVKRQPQYLGQCRRNRKFSCSIDKIASLPFGNTRNGSCARDASVSAQNWIAARRISSLVPKAFWSVVCVTPVAFVKSAIDALAKPFTDKTSITLRKRTDRFTALPRCCGRVSILFAMIANALPANPFEPQVDSHLPYSSGARVTSGEYRELEFHIWNNWQGTKGQDQCQG